jgi:acyl-CoA-dependent ceramide synthase
MTRYLGIKQIITDTLFGWFMISWLVTRHVLFLFVIWSTTFDATKFIEFLWDPKAGHYVTIEMYYGFSALLYTLQASWQLLISHMQPADLGIIDRLYSWHGSG